jgi:hypothetical protein
VDVFTGYIELRRIVADIRHYKNFVSPQYLVVAAIYL